MFCKNCGKEIKDNAKFCPYCGKEVKGRSNTDTNEKLPEREPEKSEEFKAPKPKKILYVLPGILIILVVAAVIFFAMIKPETDHKGQESKVSSDGDKEEEETEESAEEETAKEDQPLTAEQVRTSLEECLRDLEAQYGYADLGDKLKEIRFGADYNYGEYDSWTELYGIAKAKIFDLDGDGWEELLVILLEGREIHLCVYEADASSDAPARRAETVLERSRDIHNYEDICMIVDGDGVNYLLFLQAYWGGWGDGYYAQARLYRYNGTNLYTPLTIVQESEASAEYVYFARQYDADGAKLSEEVIYDDTAQYGAYLQEDHCRERMKELFGAYGIAIGNYAKMFIYDTSFNDFLAYEESREELMKLWMISLNLGEDDGLGTLIRFGFNDGENTSGYIIPGSDTMYLWPSDLYSLTQGECRLARNEIYARHGRMFDDPELQYYFNTQEWYTGTIAPGDFSDDVLNEYEIYNRDMITEYEKEMGYR